MATFPTPSQLLEQYKTILKSLRPDINVDDPSSEPIIRGAVLAGVLSGVYADQRKIDDDTFIQDARDEALDRWGVVLGIARQPATVAETGDCLFTGTPGTLVPAGLTLRYSPTGILYTLESQVTLDGSGEGHGRLSANSPGQIGNVSAGTELTILSPPSGVDPGALLVEALGGGSDAEIADSYRSRLLLRLQRTPSGGNQFDYPTFAFSAHPSVRSAFVRRFGRGLGTVDVYITTGTTDLDQAINLGLPIVRLPTPQILDAVQTYYEENAPMTDCPKIFSPSEVTQDVMVRVRLESGFSLTSVPADSVNNPLGLTIENLIKREVGRVLYKIPVGGRILPGFQNGLVVAADIEQQIDDMLSAIPGKSGLPIGKIPVLADRQVSNLDGVNINRQVLANQIVAPGTVTVILGT
jgi:uncharacterized phage protein gp47/JayE